MKTNWLLCFAIAIIPTFFCVTVKEKQPPIIKVAIDSGYVVFEEWEKRVKDQMGPHIKKAAKKMNVGDYTIDVRLLVEKDGTINAVQLIKDPGYNLGKTAEAVVMRLQRWRTTESYPNKVRSYHTVSITFYVTK